MSMCPRHVLASVSCLCFFLALPAAHADHVIDAFTTQFQPTKQEPCKPVPYMWAGKPSCPGTLPTQNQSEKQTCSSGVAGSSSECSPGAEGGTRIPLLSNVTSPSSYVTASIDGHGSLIYTARPQAPSGTLTLEYGSDGDMDLDLSSDHYFRISITSNLPACHRLPVTITLTCQGDDDHPFVKKYNINANQETLIPFSDFRGCDFTDVTDIQYVFDARTLNGVTFTLHGGLVTLKNPDLNAR